jgi:hypothetical protein
MTQLILMYPGTGVRKVVDELKAVHTDSFGYFAGSYKKFNVSIPVLKQKVLYDEVFSKDTTFVGFGANWKDMIRVIGKSNTSVHKNTLDTDHDMYMHNVEEYRSTEEYKDIDEKLLKHFNEIDGTPEQLADAFIMWKTAVEAYLGSNLDAGKTEGDLDSDKSTRDTTADTGAGDDGPTN